MVLEDRTSKDISARLSADDCVIPEEVCEAVVRTQGCFFESLARISRWKVAADLLNPLKAGQQAAVLQRYAPLAGRDVLEVGSGLGINAVVWTRRYNARMRGIEPSGSGFGESLELSRHILRANSLDGDRVISARGEEIPFRDESFDIVYSTNVLEHTERPATVLEEAIRVLRRGGLLQVIYPNYRSFFEGHYAVFHPPVFGRAFLPWYVRTIWGRDPAFARTLRTELNVAWTREMLRCMESRAAFETMSLGEELFLSRMTGADFSAWAGLGKVKSLVGLVQALKLGLLAGHLLVMLRAWTPIVLTVRKS